MGAQWQLSQIAFNIINFWQFPTSIHISCRYGVVWSGLTKLIKIVLLSLFEAMSYIIVPGWVTAWMVAKAIIHSVWPFISMSLLWTFVSLCTRFYSTDHCICYLTAELTIYLVHDTQNNKKTKSRVPSSTPLTRPHSSTASPLPPPQTWPRTAPASYQTPW